MCTELYGIYVLAAVFGIYTLGALVKHYWQERKKAHEAYEPMEHDAPETPLTYDRLREQYNSTKNVRIIL